MSSQVTCRIQETDATAIERWGLKERHLSGGDWRSYHRVTLPMVGASRKSR